MNDRPHPPSAGSTQDDGTNWSSQQPSLQERRADDPRCYVGDVVEATETNDGLAIKGRFDLDTEFGKSAYRNTKGRRVSGLSIGYASV